MTSSAVSPVENDPRLEAARKRLRESVSPADMLEAIREIVTNLLGCEEIGLFTVERGDGRLFWSFGIDPQLHRNLDALDRSALQRVLRGEHYVARVTCEGTVEAAASAFRVFIPICLDGRTVGVLVMLKLLPQKLGFDEADINLARLLAAETGRILFDRTTDAGA